jgi:hypothetical protein
MVWKRRFLNFLGCSERSMPQGKIDEHPYKGASTVQVFNNRIGVPLKLPLETAHIVRSSYLKRHGCLAYMHRCVEPNM